MSTLHNRQECPEKWVGDRPFYPGFRFRDNQREHMSGDVFPPDLLNDGHYKRPGDFSRERYPSKEVSGGWNGCRIETTIAHLLYYCNEKSAHCRTEQVFRTPFRAIRIEWESGTPFVGGAT